MAWTEDQIDTLKRLWGEGHPASAIAEKMGGALSRSSIIGKAHRLGLEARLNPTDFNALFERIVDRVVDAPLNEPCSVEEAALAEEANIRWAERMWNSKIIATHGGDPR